MALHLEIKATYRQGVEENSREEKDEGLKKQKKKLGEVEMCVGEKRREGRTEGKR